MRKKQMMEHWQNLPAGEALDIVPREVPYKHEGSTYAEDGIRITGSKKFIDSMLAVLKPLLRFENTETRLQVVYKQSTDRKTGELMDSYNCYIQVHERGGEAKMINNLVSARLGKQTLISSNW